MLQRTRKRTWESQKQQREGNIQHYNRNNDVENRKNITEMIDKTKSWIFEMINKIDQSFAR